MKPRSRKPGNRNKSIATDVAESDLKKWGKIVSYGGNAEHKRNPGDFKLSPPFGPRLGKTLCDGVDIFNRAVALKLLKKGLSKGLVSAQMRGDFPQNIWAVTKDGIALEAALDNQTTGSYHGYPMGADDVFGKKILKRWEEADVR